MRCNQVEPRTLDPTHMLTNLITHICKSGFDFFDKESLIRVSEKDKDLLPRPMITEIFDQQSAEIAKCFFSEEVEHIMKQNGDIIEAHFLKMIHEWYESFDERGILPEERVSKWINLHKSLVSGINFEEFPPYGSHVKGIPVITYGGLLQCISTRINLYQLSKSGTYKNCAISTLGIESSFSSLSKADFTMTGCPKAMQIHKIIPVMMEYNWHKSNPDKIFKMEGRQGAPYPYYNMDKIHTSSSDNESEPKTIQSAQLR